MPPPQSKIPTVIAKQKQAYQLWLVLHRNFPKTERLGLGRKIDSALLDVLEWTFAASYLPLEPKIVTLGRTISRLDVVKFFAQMAWESKLLPTDKYATLSEQLEEVGRQLGAWRKGLQSKTPAAKA